MATLMTRREIIDQYGFDPSEDQNQSIIQKGEKDTDIRLRTDWPDIPLPKPDDDPNPLRDPEDPAKLLNRNQEKPTADPARMMASGAVRNWTSDLLTMVGVASAGLSAAAKYTLGDPEDPNAKEFDFAKNLYKPGGVKAVVDRLRDKQSEMREEHPDWDARKVEHEMAKYQASPDFFEFHTDNMSHVYGGGMKLAAAINGMFGVPKTPQQETWGDDAAHIIGGVITASPSVFVRGAGSFLSRLGVSGSERLADLVLPGTAASHFTPAMVGQQAVGQIGINDILRTATGQPSAIRGNAFEVNNPETGGPSNRPEDQALGPRVADYIIPGAAAGAAVLGTAAALRGKPRLNPNMVHAGPTIDEQLAARRTMEPLQTDPTLARQPASIEAVSRAVNEWESPEKLARDVADAAGVPRGPVEVNIQAAHGLDMDRQARLHAFEQARNDGLFPNKLVQGERTVAQLERMGQQASPETRQKFSEMVSAFNAADQRLRGVRETTEQYVRNPADAENLNNLAQRLADTPESRPSLTAWTDRDIGQRINAGMADPEVIKLADHFKAVNQDINRYSFRAGMLTQEEYLARQASPYHIPMFEVRGTTYDPSQPRTNVLNTTAPGGGVTPNNVLDPFAAVNVNLAMAINEAKHNDGIGRVIDTLRPHDPNGEFVRRVGPASGIDLDADKVIRYEAGQPIVYQFSRESVATALKAQPLMLSPVASFFNGARGIFQRATTGAVFGGPASAIRSALYDASTGYTSAREGRSFGFLSQLARQAVGNNPTANAAIDTLRALDVSAPLHMSWSVLPQAWWKTVNSIGREMMDSAVTDSGLLSHISSIPGGKDALYNIGGKLAHAAEVSTWGVMKQAGALQDHPRMTITPLQAKNEYERLATEYANAGAASSGFKALKPLMDPYYAMIDNLHHMAQYAFFANNYAVLKTRYGSGAAVPAEELTRLAEETRRFSGDIWAHGGSRGYNEAMTAVPYGNINLQAFRHLAHAATAQGFKQSVDVATRMGVLAGTAYAGIKFVEGMGPEAKDWYWNKLPDWKRVGTVPIPSPEWIKDKVTGKEIKFDPADPDKYVWFPRLAAELTPITQMHLAAAEIAGYLDRGSNTARGSPGKDVLGVTASALGTGQIQPVNALLAVGGYKSDLLGPAQGRPIVQELPKGEDGETPGGIPMQAANLVRVFGGLGGDMAIRSADAALQNYERDHDFLRALERGGLEAKQEMVDERYPSVPGLWKAEAKVYQSATTTRLKELDRVVQSLRPTWSREFGRGRITNEDMANIQDPDVRATVAYTHKFFASGAYNKLKEARTMIESQMKGLDSKKYNLNPEQIAQKKRALNIEREGIETQMLTVVDTYEKRIGEDFKDLFDREKLKPELESIPILKDRYKRKNPQIAPGVSP